MWRKFLANKQTNCTKTKHTLGDVMSKLLVVNKTGVDLTPDQHYRALSMSGCIYTEDQYRDWVNGIWVIDRDGPLSRLAKVAEEKGGWLTFRLLTD